MINIYPAHQHVATEKLPTGGGELLKTCNPKYADTNKVSRHKTQARNSLRVFTFLPNKALDDMNRFHRRDRAETQLGRLKQGTLELVCLLGQAEHIGRRLSPLRHQLRHRAAPLLFELSLLASVT